MKRAVLDLVSNRAPKRLRVGRSSLPGAGMGVFTTELIRADEYIALYPGRVHLPPPVGGLAIESLMMDPAFKMPAQDTSYQISCGSRWSSPWNGGYIDGINGAACLNPHAKGHLINHPPRGTRPNVTIHDFEWRSIIDMTAEEWTVQGSLGPSLSPHALWREAREVNHMAEGAWYIDGTTLDVVSYTPSENDAALEPRLLGAVFQTVCEVPQGSELFFDYRLGPVAAESSADWYVPVP